MDHKTLLNTFIIQPTFSQIWIICNSSKNLLLFLEFNIDKISHELKSRYDTSCSFVHKSRFYVKSSYALKNGYVEKNS